MKVLVQHARANPRDWEEIDSASWAALEKKPRGAAVDESAGLVHAVNIQGNISSGYDHYAVEHLGEAVRMTMWSDESKPDGEKFAIAWTFLPLAPDPRHGGAYNTRHSQMVFAQPDVKARYDAIGPIENTQVLGWEWFVPPSESSVRHDPQLPVQDSDSHHRKLSHHGWSEWTDGVPAEHLDERGHLREQRVRGFYKPLGSTKTYYQRNVAQAAGAVAATNEESMTTATAASATLGSGNYSGGSSHLAFLFTTEASNPNDAAWPTGNYRAQLNCAAAGSGITYGMRTTGAVAGYIGRYSSDLATALETKAQTEAVFSSTGLKLGTTGSVSWSAGAAGDRYAILVGGVRAASGGNQTFTLTLNTTDSFADGPWSTVYNESLTAAGSADLTGSAIMSIPASATAAGSADAALGAANQMPAAESLAGSADAAVAGGLAFDKSLDVAASADLQSVANETIPSEAFLAASADVSESTQADFVASADLAASAEQTVEAGTVIGVSTLLDAVADALANGATAIAAALAAAGSADAGTEATMLIAATATATASADAQSAGQTTISVSLALPASAELSPAATAMLLAALTAAVAAALDAEGVVSGGGGSTYNESLDAAGDAQLAPSATVGFSLGAQLDESAEALVSVSLRVEASLQIAATPDAAAESQLDALSAATLAGSAQAAADGTINILAEASAQAVAELASAGGFTYDEIVDLIAAGEIVLTAEGQAFRAQRIFGRAGDARGFGRSGDGRAFRREGDEREFGE